METPKSARQLCQTRNATPRLSERKKKLFGANLQEGDDVDDTDPLLGIRPLDAKQIVTANITPKKGWSKRLQRHGDENKKIIRFFNSTDMQELDSCSSSGSSEKDRTVVKTRRSPRLSLHNSSPENNKENNSSGRSAGAAAAEEQLQELFTASMRLNSIHTKSSVPITPKKDIVIDETSEEDEANETSTSRRNIPPRGNKRQHTELAKTTKGLSPQRKMAKLQQSIPTKAFYSAHLSKTATTKSISNLAATTSSKSLTSKRHTPPAVKISPRSKPLNTKKPINKGVMHKIRRRSRPLNAAGGSHYHLPPVNVDLLLSQMRNEKLRKMITSKREEKAQIEKVHNIFRNAKNPIQMARPLSFITNVDDGNNNENINNNNNDGDGDNKKPIYSSAHQDDFSDIEYDSDETELESAAEADDECEMVIPLIKHGTPESSPLQSVAQNSEKRKFFKSGRRSSTAMEVKITDNIRASVCNGKISLMQEKRPKPRRVRVKSTANIEFSAEQATVDAILKNLDDTAFGDIIEEQVDNNSIEAANFEEFQAQEMSNTNDLLNDIELADLSIYDEFRKRLPYNTNDSTIIEQQHLLLDFLISNNICNEQNFTIFIADPDNHKAEAARIVDQVIEIVNQQQSEFRDRLPYNTNDSDLIAQQQSYLDFLIENDICTEENFDIFIANHEQRHQEAAAIVDAVNQSTEQFQEAMDETNIAAGIQVTKTTHQSSSTFVEELNNEIIETDQTQTTDQPKLYPIFNSGFKPIVQKSTRRQQPKVWVGGDGANQYQIDAGQKQFGAHQCKQCGLVYTVHEPEEEKLHEEYHKSLHVLRFKGWIDEDIVAVYPEWATDGRIIRLTESSPLKRRERLLDILSIVDKELGFSSYIIPKTFVAYFAVRKYQIVGLCLVQPLTNANKYLCINGVDCCSEEIYEAKCGISRIWVSPLHRRIRIASKLIQAVQFNTLFGEAIPLDKIAFSAPTENGRMFAQKITNLENFLIYQ